MPSFSTLPKGGKILQSLLYWDDLENLHLLLAFLSKKEMKKHTVSSVARHCIKLATYYYGLKSAQELQFVPRPATEKA